MWLASQEGFFKGVRASRSEPLISHVLFVDNCILFGEASTRGVTVLMNILKKYEESSRQCVNYDKSTISLVQIL